MTFTYTVNVFKELVERYSQWDDLRNFLESEEGGLFRVVDKNENGLCIIRYEKSTSKMDLPHSKWFRSVVWNTQTNRPVCVAPPKSTNNDFLFETLEDLSKAGIICQEHLDGFMINCFRDDSAFHITSRSKLDATGKFYSQKTFRDLFTEAYMATYKLYVYNENMIQEKLKEIRSPDTSNNEISVFYSFLVQNRDHRIVKPIVEDRIFVIQRGRIFKDGTVEIEDTPETFKDKPSISNIQFDSKSIKNSYAEVISESNEDNSSKNEVQQWIRKQLVDRDWEFQGLVFKDKNGNRWKFRSEKYAAVKTLRGNSPNDIERFAQLYTQNLIEKYLEYYPEDFIPFYAYSSMTNVIIKELYELYVDLHITKTKLGDEIDRSFLPHLYSIHGIYLANLRPNGKKVNLNEVRVYLHKQPWQRIVFLIKSMIKYINSRN